MPLTLVNLLAISSATSPYLDGSAFNWDSISENAAISLYVLTAKSSISLRYSSAEMAPLFNWLDNSSALLKYSSILALTVFLSVFLSILSFTLSSPVRLLVKSSPRVLVNSSSFFLRFSSALTNAFASASNSSIVFPYTLREYL